MSQSDTDKTLAAEERSEETRSFVRRVRSATRRKYRPEEKIRIVLEGFRREVIKPHSYYSWTKEFMEAGKERLSRDTVRDATQRQVEQLKRENGELKQLEAICHWKRTVSKITAIPMPHDVRTIQEAVSPRGTVLVSWKFTTFCRQPGRCRN